MYQYDLNFDYSEEQLMLRDTASNLLSKKCTFERVRDWMAAASGYSEDIWQEMAELGWMGVAIPEEYGGSGLGALELIAIMEPMGQYLMASPFLATTISGQLLLASGSEDQRKRWLPEIASGKRIITLALVEPDGSWDPEKINATAKEDSGGYILNGEKSFVVDGQNADLLIGAFKLKNKPALFLLEPEVYAELEPEAEGLMDESRRSSRILFNDFEVPRSALLTDNGIIPLKKIYQLAWLLLGAEMAGGSEGVFQLTLDYVKVRSQFGRLIGSYQAIKHPLADVMMDIENTRSLVYYAASVFDGQSAQSEIAARMAKAYAEETYTNASARAIQYHGAMGVTWECHVHLFFKRAQWCRFSFGDAIHHRRHLAELML